MTNEPEQVSNQILGMLKAGTSEEKAHTTVITCGGTIIKTSTNGRLTAILIEAADVDKTLSALQKSGCFDALQLNHVSRHC